MQHFSCAQFFKRNKNQNDNETASFYNRFKSEKKPTRLSFLLLFTINEVILAIYAMQQSIRFITGKKCIQFYHLFALQYICMQPFFLGIFGI
ncbi:MAG TPA: hypothetical protein DD400_02355 [Rhodospirillaceae bacterium]|nr:hypothetical protein [Rhodospirillaceae bacterium]